MLVYHHHFIICRKRVIAIDYITMINKITSDEIHALWLYSFCMKLMTNYKCSQNVNQWKESVKPIHFINILYMYIDICFVMIELHIHISLKISKISTSGIHWLVICYESTLVISLPFTLSHLIKKCTCFSHKLFIGCNRKLRRWHSIFCIESN